MRSTVPNPERGRVPTHLGRTLPRFEATPPHDQLLNLRSAAVALPLAAQYVLPARRTRRTHSHNLLTKLCVRDVAPWRTGRVNLSPGQSKDQGGHVLEISAHFLCFCRVACRMWRFCRRRRTGAIRTDRRCIRIGSSRIFGGEGIGNGSCGSDFSERRHRRQYCGDVDAGLRVGRRLRVDRRQR